MRPHWDDVWLAVARVVATRSLCSRAQVGAVIVDPENRIVSEGYNGPPRNFDHRGETCDHWCSRSMNGPANPREYSDCPSLHAEANALMAADRSAWQGGTIYITGHVCSDCAKLIGNSGLRMVIIQTDDLNRDYRGSDDSYRFLRALGIGVVVIDQPAVDVVAFLSQQLQSGETIAERVGGISTDWGASRDVQPD